MASDILCSVNMEISVRVTRQSRKRSKTCSKCRHFAISCNLQRNLIGHLFIILRTIAFLKTSLLH